MPYALEQASRYIDESLALARRLRDQVDREPTTGSLAVTEPADKDPFVRAQLREAYTTGSLLITVAEDHLAAIARLIRDPAAIFSVYSLARTCAEVSARATWLLDPAIDAAERVRRMVGVSLYSRSEEIRALEPVTDVGGLEASRAAFKDQAQAAGVVDGDHHLGGMAVLRYASQRAGEEEAQAMRSDLLYRHLSAFTHGTLYGLRELVRRDTARPTAQEGIVAAAVGTTAAREATTVIAAWSPYQAAVSLQFRLNGWDDQHLLGSLIYTSGELQNRMRDR